MADTTGKERFRDAAENIPARGLLTGRRDTNSASSCCADYWMLGTEGNATRTHELKEGRFAVRVGRAAQASCAGEFHVGGMRRAWPEGGLPPARMAHVKKANIPECE